MRTVITATLIHAFLAVVLPGFASAQGAQVSVQHGGCEIRITAVHPHFPGLGPTTDNNLDTQQAHEDVNKVKEALEKALEESEDMQAKVEDACDNIGGGPIDILIFRDSPEVDYGNAEKGSGLVRMDMGDIEGMGDELSGNSQEAMDTVAGAKLTRTIAHEIDHLRTDSENDHTDPKGEDAGLTTGPAVDDENLVIAQMNMPFHRRNFYGVLFEGQPVCGYSVDTDGDNIPDSSVTWILPRPSSVRGTTSNHDVPGAALDAVSTSWPAISVGDTDLDGVLDGADNCPHDANPQQGCQCVGAALLHPYPEEALLLGSAWKDQATGVEVFHSDDIHTAIPGLAQEIARILDPVLELSEPAATRIFDELFPCGEHDLFSVFCASATTPPAGSWLYIEADLAGLFPLDDEQGYHQYAFVFDADADTANNYLAAPPYTNDFFDDTDLWYQLTHDAGGLWELTVTDARQGSAEVPSDARIIVWGSELALLVPLDELSSPNASFRITAFRHEGDWGLSGGSWSADYHPRVGESKLPIDITNVIVLEQ